MKTYFVFADLPKHVEHLVDGVPLLEEGTVVDFDLDVRNYRNPKDDDKTLPVKGLHYVAGRTLKFGGSRGGLVQYLEWKRVP